MKLASFILSLLLPAFIYAGPIVTSVSPTNGPAAGGNTVQISGSGFTGATAVDFGTIPAATFTVISDTTISLTAPATFAAATIDVTVTTGSGTSPTSTADQYTYTNGNWYAYTCFSNGAFIPVNLSTNAVGTTISLPPVAGDNNNNFAIKPDGQLAVVPVCRDNVPTIDLALLQSLPLISAPNPACRTAIAPDGLTAYLLSTIPPHGIQPYDIASQTFGTFIPLSSDDFYVDIAITPNGLRAYVTGGLGTYPIDLTTSSVGMPIPIPIGQIGITPDGSKAFVGSAFGVNGSFIDLQTNIGYNTIAIPDGASHLVINPNGKTVYFTSTLSAIYPVDVATMAVGPAIPLTLYPFCLGITPDGKTLFAGISADPSSIISIDLTSFAPSVTITLPEFSLFNFIRVSPDQAPFALFTVDAQIPGQPTAFDASASFSPVGTIANYNWDFGDGNTLGTSSSTVTHIYAISGTYTVTLTVTNSGGTSTTQTYTGQTVCNNGGPSARTSQDVQILPLLPPANLKGFQKENHFLTQNELVNIVVWTPPSGSAPIASYNVYADAALTFLLGVVPANGKLEFIQHNARERPYTYYLISVDAAGNLSPTVSVLVQPNEKG